MLRANVDTGENNYFIKIIFLFYVKAPVIPKTGRETSIWKTWSVSPTLRIMSYMGLPKRNATLNSCSAEIEVLGFAS